MKEHRAVASHSADFSVQEDSSGAVSIQSLLHNFISIFATCLRKLTDILRT